MRRLLLALVPLVAFLSFAPAALASGVSTHAPSATTSIATQTPVSVDSAITTATTTGSVIEVFGTTTGNWETQIGPGDGDSGCNVGTAGTLAYWSGHQWVCSFIDEYGAYLWVPIS
jgi:hypothetical protein